MEWCLVDDPTAGQFWFSNISLCLNHTGVFLSKTDVSFSYVIWFMLHFLPVSVCQSIIT